MTSERAGRVRLRPDRSATSTRSFRTYWTTAKASMNRLLGVVGSRCAPSRNRSALASQP